jgi:hypothetical protein
VVVTTTEELLEAVAAARPRAVIRVAPGTYKTTIRFERANSGAAGSPVVLTARDGLGTAVIDGDGASITVKFSGAAHVEIRDLEITGGGHPEAGAPTIARDQGKRAPIPGAEEPAAGPAAFDDLEARLRFLKRLFEEELITEQEYAAKKAELLEQM